MCLDLRLDKPCKKLNFVKKLRLQDVHLTATKTVLQDL